MSELNRGDDRRFSFGSRLLALGVVLLAIGLERLLNSYLLGSAPALASTAATRFVIGLASIAAGSLLVVLGLGRCRQARRAAPPRYAG